MAVKVSLSRGYCAGRLRTLGSGYHFLVVFVLVAVRVTEPCCAHFAAIVWLAAGLGFCYLYGDEGRYGWVCSLLGHVGREGEGVRKARRRNGGREGKESKRMEGRDGMYEKQEGKEDCLKGKCTSVGTG